MALNVLVQSRAQLDFISGHVVRSNSSQDHSESESTIQHVTTSLTMSWALDKHIFWVFGTWSLTETLNVTWIKADPRSLSELTWFICRLWAELFHWLRHHLMSLPRPCWLGSELLRPAFVILINAEYVDGLPYQIKSTVPPVGKAPFKKEMTFVWYALFQVNLNWFLVIKCLLSKWRQTV